jgi:hypothetical protein
LTDGFLVDDMKTAAGAEIPPAPLFGGRPQTKTWTLASARSFTGGLVQAHYDRKRLVDAPADLAGTTHA